jgi:L-lactate dehydrogenase complex protein LldG
MDARRDVAPLEQTDPATLRACFIEQAQKLSCTVTVCASAGDAVETLLGLIGEDRSILSWDPACIPLPGLVSTLDQAGIQIAPSGDPSVRLGVTGADAALAATGSLVLSSGPGRPRSVSLLPTIHVAVITNEQIVPNMEAWAAALRSRGLAEFQRASSVLVISGPSRTADIAMQLVLGAHGPAELHILLLP